MKQTSDGIHPRFKWMPHSINMIMMTRLESHIISLSRLEQTSHGEATKWAYLSLATMDGIQILPSRLSSTGNGRFSRRHDSSGEQTFWCERAHLRNRRYVPLSLHTLWDSLQLLESAHHVGERSWRENLRVSEKR